jgi:TRAP transporter TAXI family solute receptor
MTAGNYLQKYWRYFTIAGLVVIFLSAGVLVVETLPPRTIVMATGAEGGANYQLGTRYREILAQADVTLQLRPTAGGLENLGLLRDPQSGVSVGFIQGGTTNKQESPNLESLGTLFFEPLWLFHRSDIGEGIQALRGRRMSIGPKGSGTRALALELVKRLKLAGSFGKLLDFTPQVAAEKLIAGDIDLAFIVTGWDSPTVQRLMTAKDITLASFPRADAYVALYPFLNKLVLPAGVGDLAMNRPPADVVLLAAKASLAVRTDLHPAIQYLLLNAAMQIHSQPGIFQKAGQFPAAESIDLPLSEEAQGFYKSGRPFLQAHLPFWIAALVERMLFVLIPLAAVLYPVFTFLPKIYDWIMRSRIMSLYDEMRSIESEVEAQGQGCDADTMIAMLDQLEERANALQLPRFYAIMLYTLRAHINLIRSRLAMKPGEKLQ